MSGTSTDAVLVTGANGFVGRAMTSYLVAAAPGTVRGAVRGSGTALPAGVQPVAVGDIGRGTDWSAALSGVAIVIHLAARVHVLRDASAEPLALYREVNVQGTVNLARQAARGGVRRFVFLSSIKVNGEEGRYRETDAPAPEDPYGISKHEAEIALRQIAADTGMAVVIIRPPLVYGPGVKANFRALMRSVLRGIPLPLGAVRNQRSLIGLDNLVDLLWRCATHPAAVNETFLASDGEDLSTPGLIRRLAAAAGRPARLLPVPPALLMAGAILTGQRAAAKRLLGSLQVDSSKARRTLGWAPPVSVDEGLRRAIASL